MSINYHVIEICIQNIVKKPFGPKVTPKEVKKMEGCRWEDIVVYLITHKGSTIP